jgi:hypothetical protein
VAELPIVGAGSRQCEWKVCFGHIDVIKRVGCKTNAVDPIGFRLGQPNV